MNLMRWCPSCETERALHEHFCAGMLTAASPCGWVLAGEPIHPSGWRPAPVVTADRLDQRPGDQAGAAPARCRNGHILAAGDLFCLDCGAEPAATAAAERDAAQRSSDPASAATDPQDEAETVIDGWRLQQRIAETPGVRERYRVRHVEDHREAVLTLYHGGAEPDPDVYAAIQRLSRDFVPELISVGRWNDRAFEVMEAVPGGTFAQLGLRLCDQATLRHLLREVGQALHAFAEIGLRHRDLRPASLLVRSRDPLDLVIGGFGSARLSAFDLDLVPPLETSRYMAPEAVAGGVAAASDWWSLGMLLLEQVTGGACFGEVHPNAWLIHVLAHGVPLPDELPPDLALLFRGLLAHDHHQRWQWREVSGWLAGEAPPAPPARAQAPTSSPGSGIALGEDTYHDVRRYALAAGELRHWDQALEHLRRGALLTWAEQSGLDVRALAALRHLARHESLDDTSRLMLALTRLNAELPLVRRGDIVTPGWLLDHPQEGWQLLASDAPDLLAQWQPDHWLARMKARVARLRERARQRSIALDEGQFRILALATSRARLAAQWQARLVWLPDSPHAGIQALAERKQLDEDDLIILLAAEIGQFHSSDFVLDLAARTAGQNGLRVFDRDAAASWLQQGRRAIWQAIDQRLQDFANCGIEVIDRWAGQYRVQRRLPLANALLLLAVPEAAWVTPEKQQYLAQLLRYFEKKVVNAALRGPLVRMSVSRGSARIDLTELDSARRPAAALLDALLRRDGQTLSIDPATFAAEPLLQHRLNVLVRNRSLYHRDSGIDGLFLGFPFLLIRDARAHVRTRIAPLLLWPVTIDLPVGQRAQMRIAFDSGREEVRLNPALDGLLGNELRERWQRAADELLQRSAFTTAEVMDALGMIVPAASRVLAALPPLTTELEPGEQALACAGVLFLATFMGQAIGADLRAMQQCSPGGTGLESLLRLRQHQEVASRQRPPESQRYLTAASDPSQEAAVLAAAQTPGLVIEGPPGTGKSQTIVNIVADAIGNGRSLLLVCQKHAALEVVHKRLVAEGLGERVVMVNDVNRDREPTIRAVREQVEALHRDGPGSDHTRLRAQLAARIEALEGELDRRHHALHAIDPRCGLSWRQLLADLINLEADAAPPEHPALRRALGQIDVATLLQLQSHCVPLLRWWLPARFEGSPLARLRPFAGDEPTCHAFAAAFGAFAQAEEAREQALASVEADFEIEHAQPHRDWLAAHAEALRAMPDDLSGQLARWLPLFGPGAVGPALIAQLADAARTLAALDNQAWQATLSPALSALAPTALDKIQRHAQRMLAPTGVIDWLNPVRWLGRVQLRRLLHAHGKPLNAATVAVLLAASRLEAAWRAPRASVATVARQLGEPLPAADCGPELTALAVTMLRQLREVQGLAQRLAQAPDRERAEAAASRGNRAAVESWLRQTRAALQRHDSRECSRQHLDALAPWLQDPLVEELRQAIARGQSNARLRTEMVAALPSLAAYQQFRTRAVRLDEADYALLAQLRPLQETLDALPPNLLEDSVRRLLDREARLAWKLAIEQAQPELLLEREEQAARVRQLADLDHQLRRLNREQLGSHIDLARVGNRRQWEDITRLRGTRTRRLREFVAAGSEIGLMQLKPVWLMNPDVASRVLPLQAALFDLVVYDEASQMPVEFALPTLYRSRIAVVSGDEKQLPPTAFFASRMEDDGDEEEIDDEAELDEELARQTREEHWNRREIRYCPDLLQLARGSLPRNILQVHYRSRFRELIAYSNAAFYDNHLHVPVRHPAATVLAQQPLEWRQIDGSYEQQCNREEAAAVVAWLAELWQQPAAQRPSVGVVTFNRKQADLIEDLIEERAEQDEAFRDAWSSERERQQDGEAMGVFVKNVENVQGDERDVIVFSTTFGRDPRGVFRRLFGVLGQTGGERRLNVAVTRSRQKMLVLSSMPVADVSDFLGSRRAPSTPRDFLQAWLAHARMLSNGDFAGAQALLTRLHRGAMPASSMRAAPDDGFRDAVERHIRTLGHQPAVLGGHDAFALDFAIENPRSGLYAIGIDCESRLHPLLTHARAREIWQPSQLAKTIPIIHRVCALQWQRDPLASQAGLAKAIEQALQEDRA